MADRRREAAREGASGGIDPLGLEPVRPERLDLVAQVFSLLGVGREAKAAEPPERVPRELAHRRQLCLRPLPERQRPIAPERGDDLVVRRRCPAERETAVAAARTLRDPARIDDANAQTRFGQRQGTRAPRHAGAHDPDVHRPARGATRQVRGGLGEPVRRHRAIVLRTTPSSTATAPASSSSASAAAISPAPTPVARLSSSGVPAPASTAVSTAAATGSSGIVVAGRCALEAEGFENVRRARCRGRSDPQQRVRACAEAGGDLARHGEHLAPVLQREVGGDERTGPLAGLDDDRRPRESRDDPVPGGEAPRSGLHAGLVLGHDEPSGRDDRARELGVGRRVVAVDATAEHRDGRPTRRERATVRLAVDAARHATDHDGAGGRGLRRKEACDRPSVPGAGPGADNGDGRTVEELGRRVAP